jgi:AcrR family transcriptional regulator
MPKIVDHDARRREIIQATWQLIARLGPEAATMRHIAHEVGVANGSIGHYFANKDELLESAYLYVYDQTNQRIAKAIQELDGRAAIRRYCLEIIPANEITILEAKIVLAFWPRAVGHPRMAAIHEGAMSRWRAEMHNLLAQGRTDGSITASPDIDHVFVESLLSMMLGLQALAVLTPATDNSTTQLAMLDSLLATL